MAGGTWNQTDMPVLPGLYLNFQAAAAAAIQTGARGIVTVPVKANWGPIREFVEVTSEAVAAKVYSADETGGATAYTAMKLAFYGGAHKVLAYRIADASAAKATLNLQDDAATPVNVVRLEAKYPGTRGNQFKVSLQANAIDSTKVDLKLMEGAAALKTFTFAGGAIQAAVDTINNDPANEWIVASKLAEGSGQFKNGGSLTFAGGNSGIGSIAAADYTDALNAMETQDFHLLALDGVTDAAIHATVVAWIDRLRSEGKGVMAVLGGSAADDTSSDAVSKATTRSNTYNHEGIVNVGVGATLSSANYSSAQISSYVAGLIAGQKLSESTTYAAAPFQGVTRRWTRSEQEQAVRNGVFLFVHDGSRVKALRGINTLTALRLGQNNAWKKIRTIRVMDAINADLQQSAEANYIGKVNNTEEGRLALVGACKQYMQSLAQSGVIEETGWNVALDPAYYGTGRTVEPEADQVYLKWEAKLTDTIEQIFGTFTVL
ncbi:phage tail sheath family protein [Paenibacillus thalictri]|uniref:Phage tail sheath protein n=1 Tax=Paenibacillus thalictri TaxID=2527873 RepID=A0A4Q9DJV6_9BACL|nr:phage tail sheath family protein [Paenibacillus thalictri]TBL71358.1 phage tail sheath protein [Paenibacillus thalictri]